MKKLTIIFAAVAICFAITTNLFAQKTAPVYLNVQIDDKISQQIYGIGSDGNGTYFHGQSSVSASFTQYGFFNFYSGDRPVIAYYANSNGTNSQGDSQTTMALPLADTGAGVTIKTHNNSTYGQNMAEGQSLCMGVTVNRKIGDYTRTIGYHAGRGTLRNTSYVKVTRLPNDINGKRVWTLESNTYGTTCMNSDGTLYDNIYDNIARIRDAKTSGKTAPDIDYGRYNMPFKLTLTEK